MQQEPEQKDELLPDGEDEVGGPVKSFLEHLEDLRWVLIKVVVAVLLGMLISLVAGNHLVTFLTWPLRNAQVSIGSSQKPIPLVLGTNALARMPRAQAEAMFGTNGLAGIEIVPTLSGTNFVLTLRSMPQEELDRYDFTAIRLKNYGPIEAFLIALQLALYGGLVISAPFVIYFIGSFVLPALKLTEKKLLYQIVGFGSFLFFLGVAFCYLIMMQVALLSTVQFSNWLGFGADEWRAEAYISFVCKFMLGMGISFQLPIVLLTLVKIGLLDHEKLSRFRSYWVVINLVVCGFATPSGDPITMLAMAIPLQLLYELSVLIARYWARKESVVAPVA